MFQRKMKKLTASLLLFFMVFSIMPVQAFAETEEHVHVHADEVFDDAVQTETPTGSALENEQQQEPTEQNKQQQDQEEQQQDEQKTNNEKEDEDDTPVYSEDYLYAQQQIDNILAAYEITTGSSLAYIENVVNAMDEDAQVEAVIAVEDLEYEIEYELDMTDAEQQMLVEGNEAFSAFATEVMASMEAVGLYTTVNVLDGKVSVTDSANSNNVSAGTVTITAKGSLFGKKTNNITITNETDSKAQLSFDYSASTYNSFTIAGASASASGNYSAILDAGANLSITLVSNSGLSNTTATLTLSNFSLTVVQEESNVTFEFDSSLGSVTVGGESITSGSVKTISGANGALLVATATNGANFLGWVDAANGQILSTAAEYTLKPAADMTVKAAFAKDGSTPWFAVGAAAQKSVSSGLLGMSKIYYHTVGTSYLFDDLNAAAAKAASDAANKTVVLMNSGTLPAGTYTIPAGVTLLIPFDSANTMYTTQVQNTGTYETPTAYRTLTMADGANLVINGAMSLSANQKYAAGSKVDGGAPTGAVSFVQMQGNSSITVNNGGALYAYGFITGSGSVTANSGATVYEMFQIADFRGGTQSTDMENGVFPLSQYYVQNIEVPLTLYAGATEYSYTTIYMSSTDFGSAVAFIAESGAMFNLKNGYVVKRYDGATD
ncbi:MAG: hypothetical protein J6J05_02485, partial [Peptococcaceae bacterium]|nr:hypothetical protein [Peptococcaceae bacterium]